MLGATIAVAGLVALMWGLSWIQHRPVPDPARTVDYTSTLAAVRADAPFHVVAPEPVPAGLRATSVTWDPVGRTVAWHLGFITPEQRYVGLYQSNGPVAKFVAASTPATTPGAPVEVAGHRWTTLHDDARGETALIRTVGGVTTVVTGTAPLVTLTAVTAALH